MFQVAEGIKGVHILGVVQSKDALEDLLKICPINPQSRYVLIEVGMQKETVQDVLTGLGIVGTMAGAQYLHDAITFALEDHELIERITKLLYPQIAKVHNTTPSRMSARYAWQLNVHGHWLAWNIKNAYLERWHQSTVLGQRTCSIFSVLLTT